MLNRGRDDDHRGYSVMGSVEDRPLRDAEGGAGELESATAPFVSEKTAATDAARERILMLQRQDEELVEELRVFDEMLKVRRQPLVDKRAALQADLEEAQHELESLLHDDDHHWRSQAIEATGPESLRFVDSDWFGTLCNVVVALNLVTMIIAARFPRFEFITIMLDNAFLLWYTAELLLKFGWRRSNLFFGSASVVWWNWLDLLIVVSGALEQWLVPLSLSLFRPKMDADLTVNIPCLRAIRFLRFFRMLRILKLIRAFVQGDMSWTRSLWFELFMSVVIAINAIVMSIELDVEWEGFVMVENLFLTIYVFELGVRFKAVGLYFFRDMDNFIWNYLDFSIVIMGMVDLWLTPLVEIVQVEVFDQKPKRLHMHGLASLLRMMRLFRILRLAKLVKSVKPLYRLFVGVMETLKAIQWVMILTFFMLYGASILWTALVGHGMIWSNEPTDAIKDSFGSVPRSMFSLFRLMNGDTEFADGIFTTVAGQVLFCGFMVLANWGLLAILTSVVSDNMIAASRKILMEEQEKKIQEEAARRTRKLNMFFNMIDLDHNGTISRPEWDAFFNDDNLLQDLIMASGLDERDLRDMWSCLSVQPMLNTQHSFSFDDNESENGAKARLLHSNENIMYCDTFIKCSTQSADERQFLLMRSRLETIEDKLDRLYLENRRQTARMNSIHSLTSHPPT